MSSPSLNSSRKQAIHDLIRLNSLLAFIPLTAQRRRHDAIRLPTYHDDDDDQSEEAAEEEEETEAEGGSHPRIATFLNYSQLYTQIMSDSTLISSDSDNNNNTYAPLLLPSPSIIHSGDTVQLGASYGRIRGCCFAVWLKKGMNEYCQKFSQEQLREIVKPQRSILAMSSSSSSSESIFDHYRLPYEIMNQLKELDTSTSDSDVIDQMRDICAKLPHEIQTALKRHQQTEECYWYAPTEEVPVIAPRARGGYEPATVAVSESTASATTSSTPATAATIAPAASPPTIQLDPLTSRPISETHDLYLFPPLDAYGETYSSITSLTTRRYLGPQTEAAPQHRVIDPLLAHMTSENGKAIQKVRECKTRRIARKLNSNRQFPHGFVACDDIDAFSEDEMLHRLAWKPIDEIEETQELHGHLYQVRGIMAEHLRWLEERLEKEHPNVYKKLNIQTSTTPSSSTSAVVNAPDPAPSSSSSSSSHKRAVSPTAEIAASNDHASKKSRIGVDSSDHTAIDTSSSTAAPPNPSLLHSHLISSSSSSSSSSNSSNSSDIAMPNVLANIVVDYVYDPIRGVMAHLDLIDVLTTKGKWEKMEDEENENEEEEQEEEEEDDDGDDDDENENMDENENEDASAGADDDGEEKKDEEVENADGCNDNDDGCENNGEEGAADEDCE